MCVRLSSSSLRWLLAAFECSSNRCIYMDTDSELEYAYAVPYTQGKNSANA